MTSVEVRCPTCRGCGYIHPPPAGLAWLQCTGCGGIGRVWAPGAPLYGCTIKLGACTAGEVVTLGSGDRGRILWHMPRKRPSTTFLGLLDPFDDHESHRPVGYPSCIGVVTISVSRMAGDTNSHASEKAADENDPIQRRNAILL